LLQPSSSFSKTLVACVVFISGFAIPARAQQFGHVSASIRDQTGAALAGVTVTVRGPESRTSPTDEAGGLEFERLLPGDYELTAALDGFETTRRAIHLEPGRALALSLTLIVSILQETIVTAGKTGEADIQSIPMAISAVSGSELTRLGTRTIEQTVAMLPSVTFTQNSTFGQLTIRGIGTNLVNAGGDPSSALYIDGVYLSRPAMAFIDFLDLERVEVLRGPQGTLYGRNAVGGALQLVSKVPTNELDASARLTAGSFGEVRADARISGALKRDRLLGSIAVVRGTRDGFVRDLDHPDHPLGGDDLTAARGQMRVMMPRGMDLLVSGDVSDQAGIPLTFNKVLQVKPGFTVNNPPDLHDVRTSTLASARVLQYGSSARLTAMLTPSTSLVSLTAWRRLDNEFLVDADVTELDLFVTHNRELQHQWSQEVTVSHDTGRLNWIAGTFLMGEGDHQTVHATLPQARAETLLDPQVDTRSAAFFGETTIGITSRLSGIFGLRYTHEQKDIDNAGGRYTLDTPPMLFAGTGYAYQDSVTHSAWTPKFGIEVTLPMRAMAYASATKGFKSGGFNWSSPIPGRGFAPEWAWSYEGGLKTELGDGRVRVNVAAFSMDYSNLQVQTPLGIGVFDIRNAAAATVRGIEIEGATRLGRGVNAGGHYTWLDATYDRYIAVGLGGVTGDVAGNRLNNAPEFAGRGWIEWSTTFRQSRVLSLSADATAQSTIFFTPFNDDIQRQAAYLLLGGRVEYGPSHRRWLVGAYARNLTNTDYIMAAFGTSPAAFGGRPGASRQFAVDLTFRR
jgi:iron complex outermembrane receptor protein